MTKVGWPTMFPLKCWCLHIAAGFSKVKQSGGLCYHVWDLLSKQPQQPANLLLAATQLFFLLNLPSNVHLTPFNLSFSFLATTKTTAHHHFPAEVSLLPFPAPISISINSKVNNLRHTSHLTARHGHPSLQGLNAAGSSQVRCSRAARHEVDPAVRLMSSPQVHQRCLGVRHHQDALCQSTERTKSFLLAPSCFLSSLLQDYTRY